MDTATGVVRARNGIAIAGFLTALSSVLVAMTVTVILLSAPVSSQTSSPLWIGTLVLASSLYIVCAALTAIGLSIAGLVRGIRLVFGWLAPIAIVLAILSVIAPVIILIAASKALLA
jgi:hypothetical protein